VETLEIREAAESYRQVFVLIDGFSRRSPWKVVHPSGLEFVVLHHRVVQSSQLVKIPGELTTLRTASSLPRRQVAHVEG
jgi:hypothetical protein